LTTGVNDVHCEPLRCRRALLGWTRRLRVR
jgi:hypothetical protein